MSTGTGVGNRLLTLPNVLSVTRLVLLPFFVWYLLTGRLMVAGAVLVLSGLTDWADGHIARAHGQESRLGQLLDPIADRLYTAATLLCLAWTDVIPWWFLGLLVTRDLVILTMAPGVRRHRLPIPPVHFVGKAATFNLFAAFPLLIFGEVEGWWQTISLATGWALAWWGTVLYWLAGLIYVWQVWSMRRAQQRQGERV